MVDTAKITALYEEIEAFSSISNLQMQCLRAYNINKKITGHLQLENLAEKIAAKRPVSSTSENVVKRRLLSAKEALAPYQQLQECYLTMQRLQRLSVNNPSQQLDVLNALKANLPQPNGKESFNAGLAEFKTQIENRIQFVAGIQQYQDKLNLNVRKIQLTRDPVKRAERLARYQKHFLKSCKKNINAKGFESEFDTQHKLWSHQFEQIANYNSKPIFNSELPLFKQLNREWLKYLLISPLALDKKTQQLEKIQSLLEKNAQLIKSELQTLEPQTPHSEDNPVLTGENAAPSTDVNDSLSYHTVSDDNSNVTRTQALNTLVEGLDSFQDDVGSKLQELQFVLNIDKNYHEHYISTTDLLPGLQNSVDIVQKMQASDVGESLHIPGQLKHIAKEARLEAVDVMHRAFTIPGPRKGLVDAWQNAVKANPATTPPFFTWLQIAPAYKDLEWQYGNNKGKLFTEDMRMNGVNIAGALKEKGRVTYLSSVEREQRLLTVQDGILTDSNNQLATTASRKTENFGDGTATFVVSPGGKLYIGQHIAAKEYHSTLLAGGSARCAGMIKINEGQIEWITNKTGHYRTSNAELVAELLRLQNQGIDLSNTKARFIVYVDNKMKFEDYNAPQLLAALAAHNANNLDLTAKAGIQFMEPLLKDAAESLGIQRGATSSYVPTPKAPSIPVSSQPDPSMDVEVNYGLKADDDSDIEVNYNLKSDDDSDIEVNYNLNSDDLAEQAAKEVEEEIEQEELDYRAVQDEPEDEAEPDESEENPLNYQIVHDTPHEKARPPSVSFSYQHRTAPQVSSTEASKEKPSEPSQSSPSHEKPKR